MPRMLKNIYCTFNAVALHTYMREIQLTYEVDEKDSTVFADSTMLSFPGLKKWRITGKLLQDITNVDASLFALIGDEVAKAVEVRFTNAAVAVGNPKFTGTGYLVKYPPIAGGVGDLHETDVEIAPASDLTRATS